ncbi:MAG: hypothetical protein WC852_05460 [Candidatus Nanoarchaeia archaeon]|jgi:hypothetical protein
MKIKFVDAHKIRNTINPEFGVACTRQISPYIPEGEMWFDKAYKKEKKEIIAMRAFEQKLMNKGLTFEESKKEAYKKFLIKIKKIPDFVKKIEKKGKITLKYVDGAIVRKYIDPNFILGSHEYVKKCVPKGEVWIDLVQDKREIKYTIIHELYERNLMIKGMDYNSAHDFALAAEKYQRRKDGAIYLDD